MADAPRAFCLNPTTFPQRLSSHLERGLAATQQPFSPEPVRAQAVNCEPFLARPWLLSGSACLTVHRAMRPEPYRTLSMRERQQCVRHSKQPPALAALRRSPRCCTKAHDLRTDVSQGLIGPAQQHNGVLIFLSFLASFDSPTIALTPAFIPVLLNLT